MSLCVLMLFVCTTGWTQNTTRENTIAAVKVQGNTHMSTASILTYIKTRVGATYDPHVLRDDQTRLISSGRFSQVIVTRTRTKKGIVVTYKVKERPRIASVQIEGAKSIPIPELMKELSFGQGDPINESAIKSGRQALINIYQNKGRHFVQVTLDKTALTDSRKVIYTIVEGPSTVIEDVYYKGNHFFRDFTLKMRLNTRAKFWFFTDGTLNTEKVDRDVTTLRNMYITEGFLDADVGRTYAFSDDKTKVTVTFMIHEGPRYRINRIGFKGSRVFSDAELTSRLNFSRGDFFTQETVRLDLKTLEDAYGELGYIDASVQMKKRFLAPGKNTPEWAVDVDGGNPALVDLLFVIEERDQYHVGEIVIQGNTITQERVVRREMNLYPAQLVNSVGMEMSKSRLMQLRLFSEVDITPVSTSDSEVKDLMVSVVEGKTAEFLVGLGVSSNNGLLGTISFTQRNFDFMSWPRSWADLSKPETFKGAGQTLSISAEPGSEVMRFSLGWSTPYIFDLPYTLSTKVYFYERGFDDYDMNELGTQVSVGHMFKNRWYAEVALSLDSVNLDVGNGAPVEVWEDKDRANMVGVTGRLVRDRTDSRWTPTNGDRFSISYEQVMGDYTFGRFETSYRIYKTVYTDQMDRPYILSGRVKFGQMVGTAPVYEKFYGGGMGSIRGFEYRGISPRGTNLNGTSNDDPIGGDMSLFAGVEYNMPLYKESLRGVVFLDTGTVESDFELTTYRISFGVGLRVTIPMFGPVPMAIDFGFPLVKDDEDDTQVFSFSLGWTF